MKRVAVALGAVGLLLLSLTARPAPTQAAWTRPGFSTATAASGVLNPVPTLSCGAASGLLAVSIPVSWTAPPTTGNGVAPTGYLVTYSGTAGSGSTTTTAPTTSVGIPGSVLTIAGSMTVTVYATYGNWVSPASLQTRTITTTLGALGIIIGWTCG
ncbi:hypothetical protein [Leifsonia poae]|uniref:hypothetical protein n=1 Tax=Leifsonia poae TaxID=110933 RepID=UPI001CBDEEAA|nr:hypothetical protein [Leifsonia poae]